VIAEAKSLDTGPCGVDDTELPLPLLDMDIVTNPDDIFGAVAAVRSRSYGLTIDFHCRFGPTITSTNPWGGKWVQVKKTIHGQ
jgi:hypothetical protein